MEDHHISLLLVMYYSLISTRYAPTGSYTVPTDGLHDDFILHIEALPRDAPPNVFGMNTNASIAKEQNETSKLFSAVLLTQVCYFK